MWYSVCNDIFKRLNAALFVCTAHKAQWMAMLAFERRQSQINVTNVWSYPFPVMFVAYMLFRFLDVHQWMNINNYVTVNIHCYILQFSIIPLLEDICANCTGVSHSQLQPLVLDPIPFPKVSWPSSAAFHVKAAVGRAGWGRGLV